MLAAIPGLSLGIFKKAAKTEEFAVFPRRSARSDFQWPLAAFWPSKSPISPGISKTSKNRTGQKSRRELCFLEYRHSVGVDVGGGGGEEVVMTTLTAATLAMQEGQRKVERQEQRMLMVVGRLLSEC